MMNLFGHKHGARSFGKWLLPAGILLVVLGLTAYISPFAAVAGFLCMAGLVISGFGLQSLIRRIRRKEGLPRVASAALWSVAGLLLLLYPFVSLRLLNGIVSVVLISRALQYLVRWRRGAGRAESVGISPLPRVVLLLILAVALLYNPLLLSVVLAYTVGFPLLVLGGLLIAAALFLRRLPRDSRDIRSSFEEPVRDAEYEIVEEHMHRPAGVK